MRDNLARVLRAAMGAFRDPTAAGLVAEVNERTALPSLRRLLVALRGTPTGRRVLRERPSAESIFPCSQTMRNFSDSPWSPSEAPISSGSGAPSDDDVSPGRGKAWASLLVASGPDAVAAARARIEGSGGAPAALTALLATEGIGYGGGDPQQAALHAAPHEQVAGPLLALLMHPKDTFGHAYGKFLAKNGFDPLGRPSVATLPELIDRHDPDRGDLIYLAERLRQIHDYLHVLTGLPPTVSSESMQKGLEWSQGMGAGSLAMWLVGGRGQHTPASVPGVVKERLAVWGRGGAWALWHHNRLGMCDVASLYYEDLFSERVESVRRIAGLRPGPHIDDEADVGFEVYRSDQAKN